VLLRRQINPCSPAGFWAHYNIVALTYLITTSSHMVSAKSLSDRKRRFYTDCIISCPWRSQQRTVHGTCSGSDSHGLGTLAPPKLSFSRQPWNTLQSRIVRSSLQTLFTDFDCRNERTNDQKLKISHNSPPDSWPVAYVSRGGVKRHFRGLTPLADAWRSRCSLLGWSSEYRGPVRTSRSSGQGQGHRSKEAIA